MEAPMIIQIDEEKCIGCGLCTMNCAEGAIEVIDGKARLISHDYCDGLGKCLPHCPQDALRLVERKVESLDSPAPKQGRMGTRRGARKENAGRANPATGGGCPGSRMMSFDKAPSETKPTSFDSGDIEISIKTQLRQWPVQLKLVGARAPYFEGAHLLVTADCVPFAYPNYHLDMLKGRVVVVGCPKLDDIQYYIEKLTDIISKNSLKSVTVAFMEVPCCQGIVRAIDIAMAEANKNIPVNKIKVSLQGEIL